MNPRTFAQAFTVTPAVCRTEYPATGGNHILHVSETESRASRDGYIARSERAAYYITRDDRGRWSAQKIANGVAENWYCRFDFPSRVTLLAALATAS